MARATSFSGRSAGSRHFPRFRRSILTASRLPGPPPYGRRAWQSCRGPDRAGAIRPALNTSSESDLRRRTEPPERSFILALQCAVRNKTNLSPRSTLRVVGIAPRSAARHTSSDSTLMSSRRRKKHTSWALSPDVRIDPKTNQLGVRGQASLSGLMSQNLPRSDRPCSAWRPAPICCKMPDMNDLEELELAELLDMLADEYERDPQAVTLAIEKAAAQVARRLH